MARIFDRLEYGEVVTHIERSIVYNLEMIPNTIKNASLSSLYRSFLLTWYRAKLKRGRETIARTNEKHDALGDGDRPIATIAKASPFHTIE